MLKRILNFKARGNRSSKKLHISESDVLSLVKYTKRTKKIADSALENTIIPFPNFDATSFNDEFWYVDKKEKYGASYQLYVQSLRVCAELMNEYENSEDPAYLRKAGEIIHSWMRFVDKDPSEKMVWYDHPTANRIQVIVHFLYHAKKNGMDIEESSFYDLLYRHAEVMSSDAKYNNNNHGLMMDRSLMILGNVLDDEYLFTKGYYRAIDTFWYSYSYQGIHLENSPEYHNMVTNMYEDIESYLNRHDTSFGKNITNYMELARSYPKILVKPDGMMPSIGDSGKGVFKKQKIYRNIYDVEAGIAVMQNKNETSFYVSFVCGYSSVVHKHKDDLSLTLNYKGKDFLVDPGKYNYSKSDERKYVVSKEAHSSFHLQNYDYSLTPDNRFERKIRLDGFTDNSRYSMVVGRHADYDDVDNELVRTIIVFKSLPAMIIIDETNVASGKPMEFVQSFNMHHEVEIEGEGSSYTMRHEEIELTIKQLSPDVKPIIENGEDEGAMAINTAGFGKGVPTRKLKYHSSTSDRNVFTTLIYDENLIEHFQVKVQEEDIHIELDDENYTIIR